MSFVICWTTCSHMDHCRLRHPFLLLIDQTLYFLDCFNISVVEVLQWVSMWLRSCGSETICVLKCNYNLCTVIQMALTKTPPWLWVSSLEALRVSLRSNRRFNLYVTSVSSSRLSFVESIWRLTRLTRSSLRLQNTGSVFYFKVLHSITIRPHQPYSKPHNCIIWVVVRCITNILTVLSLDYKLQGS
jgi:hypothetical protein